MGKEKRLKYNLFTEYQITHHSFVDMMDLLGSIPKWFNDHQYYAYEIKCKEKEADTGGELESNWTGMRDVTDYIRFHIELFVHVRDLKPVVLEDGTETYWGRLVIRYSCKLEKNYQKTFNDSTFQELVRQLYERYYLIPNVVRGYEGKLFIESNNLFDTLKAHLK
jgi:hypothetical protein